MLKSVPGNLFLDPLPGHIPKEFDIPYLCRRMLMHSLDITGNIKKILKKCIDH